MRLNEISPAARKCVRWMRAHSGISRTRQDIEKQSRTSVPAVTEALGYLSDNRQLYTSFDARPEMSNGIPKLNSITLYYRFTEDFEAFDRSVRAERDKIYPPKGRCRSVFESKKE